MVSRKKSIAPFPSGGCTLDERGKTLGIALSIALCFFCSGQPVLASGTNRQPPAPVIAATRLVASQRTGIPAERWQVRAATPRTWPDGCLGLPNPDELCTQALVEGWEIVLTDNGKTWTYRTDSTGRNTRPEPKK